MIEEIVAIKESLSRHNNPTESNKKNRRSRKSKQSDAACDVYIDVSSCSSKASLSEPMRYRERFFHEPELVTFMRSTHEADTYEEFAGSMMIHQQDGFQDRRSLFPCHWSEEAVSNALKVGVAFKALFCVNAYKPDEAYCRIDGLQTDILISGLVTQNRAVEGDIVAVVIDNPSLWPRMKGSNGSSSSSASNGNDSVHSGDGSRGKSKQEKGSQNAFSSNGLDIYEDGSYSANDSAHSHIHDLSRIYHANGNVNDLATSLEKLCTITGAQPTKRPTGSVVAIIEKSPRRDSIVGFLCTKQLFNRQQRKKGSQKNRHRLDKSYEYVLLTPNDPKFTKMAVSVRSFPADLMKRLEDGDSMIDSELVAAKIVHWAEDSDIPYACVVTNFGRGSDVDAQIASILFENGINTSEFSPEVLSCLPHIPWEVPQLVSRKDFRKVCVYTIDPVTASDLDDALSVEKLPDGHFCVGVHIADVSHFMPSPDTDLDADARNRSTSVYLQRSKLPMLPPILSDNLASLDPGEDRLTFSIIWKLNPGGEILDRWAGLTIIRSCCKLSYEHAQDILDGKVTFQDSAEMAKHWPTLYGDFEWHDVLRSVKSLHQISQILRNNRFKNGAVSIENSKPGFLFDDQGLPYDAVFKHRMDSHFLVEEFMLLANRTAAELLHKACPSSALLRRHPEPNVKKLREFESLCNKHGLKLNFSSPTHFHQSLEAIRNELKDPVLSTILISYAARPMRLAEYICSGDYNDSDDLIHYSLGFPLYTHFTSPLRRYPDIVVHRTLKAILQVEGHYLPETKDTEEAQGVVSDGAKMHRVSDPKFISDVASHSNDRKLAARHVNDAIDKLYLWALVRKKGVLYSEAAALNLGPRFMTIYIPKLAIEKRIHYDEVEDLFVEWLETTETVILSLSSPKKRTPNGKRPGKKFKPLDDAVTLVNPVNMEPETSTPSRNNRESQSCSGISILTNVDPACFPLTIRSLSTFPIALHAVGGDGCPIDIVARLYCYSYSYFC